MSGRNFTYRPRTIEDVVQRQQEISSDSPGVIAVDKYKVYKPKKGDNHIRILPATWEGARHWAFDVWVHGQVGAEKATVICTNRMGMGRCYGCEQRVAAERAGDEEMTKEYRPRRRAACWLIDRAAEDEGPQLWLMPASLDEDIQGISIDKTDGQLYLVDDPHAGYDVTFDRTGERINTRYNSPNLARRATSVDPAYLDYVADNPVPECLIWRTYEEVRAMYDGGMGGTGQDQPVTAPTSAPRQFGRGGAAPPRNAPAAMPSRGAPGTRGPAPGYPPRGAAPAAPVAPVARRGMGVPNGVPPRGRAAPPPVDHYQGEEYAVDPNYPPPNGNSQYAPEDQQYYDPNAPQDHYNNYAPEYAAPETDGPPPWDEDPNAINYNNPPQQYAPQQQRPAMPQRRTLPPQQTQAPPPPQSRWASPGRGNAPPPQPQRGGTSAAETAAQLKQRFTPR